MHILLKLDWNLQKREDIVNVDGRDALRGAIDPDQVESLSYLRMRSLASKTDPAARLLESVKVEQ